jgi:uncharacterized protein YqgQ
MTTIQIKTPVSDRSHKVEFIRYDLPDGRRSFDNFLTNKTVYAAATRIINRGHRFEVEILRNGMIHATITDDEADHAHVLHPNGPGLELAIDKMIIEFDLDGNQE